MDNPFGQLAAGLIPFFDDPDFTSYFDIGSLSSIWHKWKEKGEIDNLSTCYFDVPPCRNGILCAITAHFWRSMRIW